MSAITYRKDIQILRGVSILLVLFFHLSIPGFDGGFLGVDIFFVISGFLMAGLYDPAQTRDFYLKRAKRILPAYFVAILATVLVCMVLTTPNDFNQVITQSVFAVAFASNIGFWFENSYFDKAAFKPLLHLWSLGVEIQFYLLLPVFHRLITRYRWGYAVLFAGSLAACVFILGISPKTSFFMMPLRLWEFMIGYGVVLYLSKQPSGAVVRPNWVGAVGLLSLVVVPMVGNIEGTFPGFFRGHPGLYAMIVAVLAGTVVACGLPQKIEDLRISTLLERVGKYSYSVYLVHFPVIVLFLYQPFSGTRLMASGLAQFGVLGALIAVLSVLMFKFVESPLRSRRQTPLWLLPVALGVVVLGPVGAVLHGMKFSKQEMAVFEAWTDRSTYRCGKMIRLLEPGVRSCEITTKLDAPKHRILLVGDSHSDSIKTSFKFAAESQNAALWFLVENNPLRDGNITPEILLHEAELRGIDTLVLHFSPALLNPETIERVVNLAEKRKIAVSLVLPVPVWKESIPKALYQNSKRSIALPVMTVQDYETAHRDVEMKLSKIQSSNFKIYPVAEFFCRPNCQFVDVTGKPLYFDDSHLTLTGAELLQPLFAAISKNGG